LEITLAAESEFGGGTVNAVMAAFARDEHGEFASDFVIFGNGKGAELTLETFVEKLERDHGTS
jgi:hypothetical protein